eukprot:scaffold20725_cov111-Isochrysis_galbana.AAC.13
MAQPCEQALTADSLAARSGRTRSAPMRSRWPRWSGGPPRTGARRAGRAAGSAGPWATAAGTGGAATGGRPAEPRREAGLFRPGRAGDGRRGLQRARQR